MQLCQLHVKANSVVTEKLILQEAENVLKILQLLVVYVERIGCVINVDFLCFQLF